MGYLTPKMLFHEKIIINDISFLKKVTKKSPEKRFSYDLRFILFYELSYHYLNSSWDMRKSANTKIRI